MPIVKIEPGARSLLEPTEAVSVQSMVETALPSISTSIYNPQIRTALSEKTFLEKAFLLHELFSVGKPVNANRKSRHIYDLHVMMQKGVAERAVANEGLWQTLLHHRSTLTSMLGVDYTGEIRDRIQLTPPTESLTNWETDYVSMKTSMIYEEAPSFDTLLQSMKKLEAMFRNRNCQKDD